MISMPSPPPCAWRPFLVIGAEASENYSKSLSSSNFQHDSASWRPISSFPVYLGQKLPHSSARRLVVLTGARQTGKTTLSRSVYGGLEYSPGSFGKPGCAPRAVCSGLGGNHRCPGFANHRDTVKQELIRIIDPGSSRKNSKYVPFWV
jgi:hypothetical protein